MPASSVSKTSKHAMEHAKGLAGECRSQAAAPCSQPTPEVPAQGAEIPGHRDHRLNCFLLTRRFRPDVLLGFFERLP